MFRKYEQQAYSPVLNEPVKQRFLYDVYRLFGMTFSIYTHIYIIPAQTMSQITQFCNNSQKRRILQQIMS